LKTFKLSKGKKMRTLILTLLMSFLSQGMAASTKEITHKLIPSGPFQGKTALWDYELKTWIIPGESDNSKLPPLKTYSPSKETFNIAPGVRFDQTNDYPENFKKIHWIQNPVGCNDQGQSMKSGSLSLIEQLLPKGYGFIFEDGIDLETLNSPHNAGLIAFDPRLPRSAYMLYRLSLDLRATLTGGIVSRNKNQFEIGVLLQYKIQDSYTWCFGSEQSSKAYPTKRFYNKPGYEISAQKGWREIGLNRIKKEVGEEYDYVVAGEPPTDDPNFGSQHDFISSKEEVIKYQKYKNTLTCAMVLCPIVYLSIGWGIYSYFF
jgi:hypothetical protein